MMKNNFRLAQYGKHLWTRELAQTIRGELFRAIRGLREGEALTIDAKGVEVFDYSFANELFGKTLLTLPAEYPGRFVIVENLTQYTRENLAKALEGLQLAMIERKGDQLCLIGKAHPVDRETFQAIVNAGRPVTAVELKDQFKINLTAMNERLSKLSTLGLVLRDKALSAAGREHYLYSVPA